MDGLELTSQTSASDSAQTRSSPPAYPSNCWWVAATTEEVTRAPLSRWLLDQRVVLFRTVANAVTALEDRCAHRWAPLSQGRLIDDEIACPYHGFRYNTHGTCTHIPTQSHVPTALKVRSYPARDHGPFVWIWMGDAAKADPALLPEIPWSDDPAYVRLHGYSEVRCSFMAIQENLIDDAHFNYLHCPRDIDWRQQPTLWALPAAVEVTDRTVTTVMNLLDVPLAPVEALAMGFGPGKRVDRLGRCTSAPPGCYFAEWVFKDPSPTTEARGSYKLCGVHGMTPISADRSHWWWTYIQDYGHQAPRAFEAGWRTLLKQDKDVLEAIHLTAEREARPHDAPQVLVIADRALGEMRRLMREMIDAEFGAQVR